MYLLVYYFEPKLTSNAAQIILAIWPIQVYECTCSWTFYFHKVASAATNVRGGGRFGYSLLYDSSRNATVKELLKSVHVCQSYPKINTCTFS